MTYPPTLLDKIPDEYKPLAAVAVGAFVLVLLVLAHGAGIHTILVLHTRRMRLLRKGRPRLLAAISLFALSIFSMLVLHVAGFAMWAYALILLGLVKHASNAIYFAANAYTTLGFGNVDLSDPWRIISPIIGISGLFTFAWTTGALANVVSAHRELMDLLENEREREFEMRSSLRKEIWKTLQNERSSEVSEKSQAKTEEARASLRIRIRVWKELKKRVKLLRQARNTEILELRRKERENEQKLGPGNAPEKPEGDDESA